MSPPSANRRKDIQSLKKTADVFLEVAGERNLSELIAAVRYLQERDGDVTKTSLQEALTEPLPTREALYLTRHLRQHQYTGPEAIERRTRSLPQIETCVELLRDHSKSADPDLLATLPDDDAVQATNFKSLLTELLELIKSAEDHLWLISPYLSEEVFDRLEPALRTAVGRGASISLLTRYLTYGGDESKYNRTFAQRLMETPELASRTTLYEYVNNETWVTFHAKVIIADQQQAYLGTANMTHKGFLTNLELGVLFRGDAVSHLCTLFESLQKSPHLHEVAPVADGFVRLQQ